jgi:hypothetical protein
MSQRSSPPASEDGTDRDYDRDRVYDRIEKAGRDALKAAVAMKNFNPDAKESDWKRFRSQFLQIIAVGGEDLMAALLYTGSDIPVAPAYPVSSVASDTVDSAYRATIPQLRQRWLLAALKAALDPEGEPMRIIKNCKQAGGVMTRTGESTKKQAWQLLIDRYQLTKHSDTGDQAQALFAMAHKWPKEITSSSWQRFYAEVCSNADRSGLFPQSDDTGSTKLRSACGGTC